MGGLLISEEVSLLLGMYGLHEAIHLKMGISMTEVLVVWDPCCRKQQTDSLSAVQRDQSPAVLNPFICELCVSSPRGRLMGATTAHHELCLQIMHSYVTFRNSLMFHLKN